MDRNPVELFSNEVAATALIPAEFIQRDDSNVFRNAKEVFKQAKTGE